MTYIALNKLRKLSKELSKTEVQPVTLTKDQADAENNNLPEGVELFKEGDICYPAIFVNEDIIDALIDLPKCGEE